MLGQFANLRGGFARKRREGVIPQCTLCICLQLFLFLLRFVLTIAFLKSENIKCIRSLIYTEGGEGNLKTAPLIYETWEFAIQITENWIH